MGGLKYLQWMEKKREQSLKQKIIVKCTVWPKINIVGRIVFFTPEQRTPEQFYTSTILC